MEEKEKQLSDIFFERVVAHELQGYKDGNETLEEAVHAIQTAATTYLILVGIEQSNTTEAS